MHACCHALSVDGCVTYCSLVQQYVAAIQINAQPKCMGVCSIDISHEISHVCFLYYTLLKMITNKDELLPKVAKCISYTVETHIKCAEAENLGGQGGLSPPHFVRGGLSPPPPHF